MLQSAIRSIFNNANKKESLEDMEERVVVMDQIAVFGNLHPQLSKDVPSNDVTLSSFTDLYRPTALIASSKAKDTAFYISTGFGSESIRIALNGSMKMSPNFQEISMNSQELREITVKSEGNSGKYISFNFSTQDLFHKWHHAIRESIAELLFVEAFRKSGNGSLKVKSIENAIENCERNHIVPLANCHLLRAKRLKDQKVSKKVLE
jgi:hypothetical protein